MEKLFLLFFWFPQSLNSSITSWNTHDYILKHLKRLQIFIALKFAPYIVLFISQCKQIWSTDIIHINTTLVFKDENREHEAHFKRRTTAVPNSIDQIKFDLSTAVARCLKPSRATAV